MNKPVFILLFFFLSNVTCFGQNLVPNPSFEEYDDCPSGMADFSSVSDWFTPSMATPDYFNECANPFSNGVGVPVNEVGYQLAEDGRGYAGLVSYIEQIGLPTYREYIAVKLSKELNSGTYYFCFWVSPIDSLYSYISNNVGIAVSKDSVVDYSSESLINISPVYSENEVFLDRGVWHKIEGSFVADGGEEFIYIGNFLSNTQTSIELVDSSFLFNEVASYFYIDNVYLGLKPCTEAVVEIPNVFTPNNDGINDVFTFVKSEGVFDYTITILNRWGNRVYFGENEFQWDGTSQNSEPVADGTYFYILEYNNKEVKNGFVQVIR